MKILDNFFKILLLLIITYTFSSCSGIITSQKALQFDKSQCNKQAINSYTVADLPKAFHELKPDTILTNRFTNKSLNIANSIGLIEEITQYIKLSNDYKSAPSLDKRISLIELLQRINLKINTASLEVSAIASELDCEEERANQYAYLLKEQEGKTEKKLIIGSIIIGAAGAILAEVISKNSTNTNLTSGFTIGVSLIEASLGALMLVNKRKIEFYHSDNALSDIWNNSPVSSYFPSTIWYYLTYENPQTKEKSLAKLLVEKWYLFGQISKNNKNSKIKTSELYFGKGGEYRTDELINRADMLDQTESYVALMKQDLKTLSHEISKLPNN